MQGPQKAKELLQRYATGACTAEEQALVEAWYASWNDKTAADLREEQLEAALDRIFLRLPAAEPVAPVKRIWPRIVAAAGILLVLTTGIYYYQLHHTHSDNPKKYAQIVPGGNKAVLILGNGKRILLDSITNGDIATQAGVTIRKTGKGQLEYDALPASAAAGISFNTIETPRGGEYKVILPDGSAVWLNAASSLTYPTRFTGKERKVTLRGEGYFEIAKNAGMPFKVIAGNQIVDVLGTRFNINAYSEEGNIKTTLLQGSVSIKPENNATGSLLEPGQMAIVTSRQINILEVDTEDAIAWKNGFFTFNNEQLEVVMNKIARWYDVDIEYAGKKPDKIFGGTISKAGNVSEVLEMLESTGSVHFKIAGRKILVLP